MQDGARQAGPTCCAIGSLRPCANGFMVMARRRIRRPRIHPRCTDRLTVGDFLHRLNFSARHAQCVIACGVFIGFSATRLRATFEQSICAEEINRHVGIERAVWSGCFCFRHRDCGRVKHYTVDNLCRHSRHQGRELADYRRQACAIFATFFCSTRPIPNQQRTTRYWSGLLEVPLT